MGEDDPVRDLREDKAVMNTMTYFRFFQDLWRFFREHSQPVSADEWWQRLMDDADQLADSYGQGRFVDSMISAVVLEIDKTFQERNV